MASIGAFMFGLLVGALAGATAVWVWFTKARAKQQSGE